MNKSKKILIFTSWIILCASFGYFLPKIPLFKELLGIKVVKVIGFKDLKKEDIENIFSGENWFFLDEDKVKNKILEKYREIKNIEVKKLFIGEIHLYITERKPVAFVYYNKKKYISDEDGFLFWKKIKEHLPEIYIYDKSISPYKKLMVKILKTKEKLNRYIPVKKVIINKNLISFISKHDTVIIFSKANISLQLKKLEKFAKNVNISNYKYLNFSFDSMIIARR